MINCSEDAIHSRFLKLPLASLLIGLSLFSPLIASATTYLPGATLEPDCAPGTPDCGVSPIGDAHTGSGAPTSTTLATGALYFDTAGGIFYAYNGTAWVSVGSGTTISSLNGQSGASQTFAIGTSGTDAAWSSATNVHTLNIPDASLTARGLITTGTQTIAGNKTFSGNTILSGNLSIIGDFSTPLGTELVTTGTQNDVAISSGGLFRYNGLGTAAFSGFAGGTDGKFIRIINISASSISFANQDATSAAENRIITTTGNAITITTNGSIGLQYDGAAQRWRVVNVPANAASIAGFAYEQNGNGFGATAVLGTTDANALNLITSGTTRFALAAGASTLTGTGPTTLSSTGTLALSSAAASAIGITTGTTGALTLDSGTTGGVNLGNGAASKIITIGNSTGTTALNLSSGSGGISLAGNVTIPNGNTFSTGTGTTTIKSTSISLTGNDAILNMTGTGILGLNTTTNRAITTGTGLVTIGGSAQTNGNLTIAGNLYLPKGADFATSGTVNNVDFGAGSQFRYIGTPPTIITGIAGGSDGRLMTLINSAGAGDLTLKNANTGSLAENRIETGTASDMVIPEDSAVILQYEDYGTGEKHWHLLAPPSNVAAVALAAFLQGGNSFGATATLGTDDFYNLNLKTNGATALALDTSGNANLTGDLTVTGGDIVTPAATALNITTGTTGILTLDSGTTGAINIGASSVAKIITIGNTTGATAVNIDAGSGGINFDGNTTFTDGNSFTSGSGAFHVVGDYATPKGTDYTTTGVQNNVNIGTGSLIRYTGAGTATFTGITGGTDGRQVRIMNASAYTLSFTNEDSGSTAANRILTSAVGGTLNIPAGISPTFQYDSGASRWRLVVLPASSGTISGFAYIQGGNAFGVAANLGTTDANALNLKTNNVTAVSIDTSSNANFTGDITVTGGDVVSPAASALNITTGTTGVLTLDSGSTGAVNLGTGAAVKTISIGNTAGATRVNIDSGTAGIHLQAGGFGSTGNVVIGPGTGSATPDFFVLDSKNDDATDPAGGVNGASYYNTTSNKFRCYEGGGWKDCDSTGGTTTLQTAYNSSPAIVTSSSHDLALTLTSGNFTATGAGAVNLTPTTASSFTSGGALTFTAGATSTWGTTAGDLKLQIAGTSTTGSLQIGAGGTGSATPDLVVLDTKSAASGSGDPTGTKGATYYNIASEKFRCFEGTEWKDCDTGGGVGAQSLNGQSGVSQSLVVGNSGTDFNIVSALDVHTFNIPDAALTARGLVTTGTQSFEGAKTFNNNLLVNGDTTIGNATGDALTVNGSAITLAGNSSVLNMTGTGTLSLNTVTNRAITTGTGLFTTGGGTKINGDLTYTGALINPRGADFSVVGSQNNLELGSGTWFRFTGASQITITGIASPSDGRQVRLTNASSSNMVFANQDVSSTDVNRIITPDGGNLTIPPNATATFQYDSATQRWRLVILPASSATVASFAYIQGGNAFGATATLGTTDAYALNLKTNNVTALALDTSGNGNLTGDLTVTGGDISTPAATSLNMTAGTTGVLTLDTGSTGAINIGTNSNAKILTIGNTSGATAVHVNSGSGNVLFTSSTTTFQTATATNDKLALVPHSGAAASFTGNITSADITVADKTWTLPNLTGNILLDTSTCPSTSSFACGAGNNTGATLTLGTTDANAMILETGGATRFTVAAGAATLTGTGTTSVTSTGSLSLSSANTTAVNVTTGTTGVLTLDSGTTGGVNLGTGATSKTVTVGNTTGTSTLNLNSGSGGIALGGNTTISGANTFATGSGTTTINSTAITLAGASAVMDLTSGTLGLNTTSNQPINTGTGLLSVGGALSVTGALTVSDGFATPKGADFATTGTVNNVDFGNGSLFRYTGINNATLTGIANGIDGKRISIMNVSSFNLIIANESASSTDINRILTTSGANVTIPSLSTVGLQYDAAATRWRVINIPVSSASISAYGFLQSGNAFGATAVLGTTDANALNLITSGATRFTIATGSPTLTGTGSTIHTSTGSMTVSSAAGAVLTLDSGTTGTVNLGTGTAGKTINIGTDNTTADIIGLGSALDTLTLTGNSSSTIVLNAVTISAAELARLDGHDAALVDTNDAVATAITGTGALDAGSITSGFGAIDTGADNITTTGTVSANNFDRSTSGALTFGNTNATSASICNSAGCDTVTIGTNADADTITIGDTLDSLSFASTGLNLTIGGALTGVASIDTIATSATALTFAGVGAISSTTSSSMTVDSGSTGSLLLGTGVAAKTITIGNGTDDTFSLNSSAFVVSTTGALTGVTSVDTIAHSATAITFAGAGTISSTTTSAITLDSGSSGDVNVGTGATAKSVTIGNVTGATSLNLKSGTGNILLTVDGTASSGMVRIGNSATATPDLLVLDNGTADPTGVNGGMYYSTGTNKLRCYENGAWKDCISTATGAGTDIQHAALYDTNEALTNVPTGGAQVTLGTVSVTPTTATGDIYVTGYAEVRSGNNTDQPFQLVIETTANCTGTTVGNADVTYTITSASSTTVHLGNIRISGIAVDAGASAHPYSLCGAVTSGGGDTDVLNWGIEALVIDTGADLAENYTSNDASLEAGDVVALDGSLQTGVKKSSGLADSGVIGIVSTRPGQLIGGVSREGVQVLPVALVGRVPVKVSAENGAIAVGDYLVPSSTPGIAMKANATGTVIGQAMSSFTGSSQGIVLAFVKNFAQTGGSVLLGSVSPDAAGLTGFITTIQAEAAHDPIAILTAKIGGGTEFLTDFVAARVTAIRGYFDELFTKKIHTDQLCVKKSDGTEICVTGDQLQNAVGGTVQNAPVIAPAPVATPVTVDAPAVEPVNPPPAMGETEGASTNLAEPTVDVTPAEPSAESSTSPETAPAPEASASAAEAPASEPSQSSALTANPTSELSSPASEPASAPTPDGV